MQMPRTCFLDAWNPSPQGNRSVEGLEEENAGLREELLEWQEKYTRLKEQAMRLQNFKNVSTLFLLCAILRIYFL